ncbi:MAG: fibronectin type III-like domain-contianing protein, partial [Chitinivibrionales bacterium]
PGMQTGRIIADILFGKVNPSGRLSVSIPREPGQNPVYYNYYPGQHGDGYADLKTQGALYPFGFGLSYTEYSYKDLKLDTDEIDPEGTAVLSLEIENTGDMDGEETVQLYINDKVSSRTTPVKELKGFKKIFIAAGESVPVSFKINRSNLPPVNSVLEPGLFELMAGPNSCDNVLLKTELLVKEKS